MILGVEPSLKYTISSLALSNFLCSQTCMLSMYRMFCIVVVIGSGGDVDKLWITVFDTSFAANACSGEFVTYPTDGKGNCITSDNQ